MARAAYVLDGILQKIGLNGKVAYTLLMGFGCSASAIFTAKSIEQPSIRLKTVMITPFMSCSARMPVFLAIASIFFPKFTYLIITALYFGGIVVACLLALVFNKFLKINLAENDFFIELPPYRFPSIVRVLKNVWQEIKYFFIRICTVLFLVNIIVWILASFDWTFSYVGLSGDSILKSISLLLLPLFLPIGITKWQAVSALLSGFVAKETVISVITTLGGINEVLPTSMQALPFLVFVLLYTPCVATIAAIYKELGKKWALISFLIHTAVSYVVSMLVYGLTILFTIYSPNVIIIPLCIIIILSIIHAVFQFEKPKIRRKE
jgi:ferrous iron transport protein B